MDEFVSKRGQNYFWETVLINILKKSVLKLKNTFITPNMVTVFSLLINVPICCLFAWNKKYILVSIFIQVTYLFDVLDGNLARNKKMTSELGKRLDQIADFVFYTVFFLILGWRMDVSFAVVVLSVLCQHIYGLIATFYIVPHIRKNPDFKRTKVKQYFYNRGILFGMDASFQCIVTSIMLLTPLRDYLFFVNMTLWIVDIIYRIYEVKMQRRWGE